METFRGGGDISVSAKFVTLMGVDISYKFWFFWENEEDTYAKFVTF